MMTQTSTPTAEATPTLLGRTIGHLRRIWRTPESNASADELQLSPELNQGDSERLIQWMDGCLLQECNEVTARNRAVILGRSYLNLNKQGRPRSCRTRCLESRGTGSLPPRPADQAPGSLQGFRACRRSESRP